MVVIRNSYKPAMLKGIGREPRLSQKLKCRHVNCGVTRLYKLYKLQSRGGAGIHARTETKL